MDTLHKFCISSYKLHITIDKEKAKPAAKRGRKATVLIGASAADLIEKAELPWLVIWLFVYNERRSNEKGIYMSNAANWCVFRINC
jgi:hypothetical protein